jgi:hypothetical protein
MPGDSKSKTNRHTKIEPASWIHRLGLPINAQARVLFLFWLFNLVFLISFADRDGYEGDDLNSIVPMFHLAAAKSGALEIYRYAWQPLSYELGAAVFELTGRPTAIFLLAPIAGALSLLLLLLISWRDRTSPTDFLASLVALLAIPELWFSGLYYNSTIIGLPFALTALVILYSRPKLLLTVIAGTLTAAAILIRVDFVLAVPAFLLISWLADRSVARPLGLALSIISVLAIAIYASLFDPVQAIEIYKESAAEIVAKADMGGWNLRTKLNVMSVTLSPVGWALVLSAGPLVVYRSLRRNRMITLLWMSAIAPMVLPLLNILSAKYFIPLAIFVPFFLKECLYSIEARVGDKLKKWPLAIAASATVALLLISVSLMGKPPFVLFGMLASRPVGTHDGLRSYGGYIWQIAAMDRFAQPSERQLEADRIRRAFLNSRGPDIVLVGVEDISPPGSIGWRHLQLELERSGIHGELVAPHRIQFERNGRTLTLVTNLPPDLLKQLDRGRGVEVIDLR